jgi:hypothetical protein
VVCSLAEALQVEVGHLVADLLAEAGHLAVAVLPEAAEQAEDFRYNFPDWGRFLIWKISRLGTDL